MKTNETGRISGATTNGFENICKFVRSPSGADDIHILHFVYERKADFRPTFLIPASYALCLVTAGSGILHTTQALHPLTIGDLFFTFSAKPYYIENTGDLQFLYISFIGQRIPALLQRISASDSAPVYHDYSFLMEHYHHAFDCARPDNTDLIAEALLLYTLSFLCQSPREPQKSARPNHILAIKEYVDLHYTDADLNLDAVSRRFGYTPKYLSAAFVKLMKISFTAYLRQLRMQHAKSLLDSGISGIKQVALACGYHDALYFSKVFDQYFGICPKKYRMADSHHL